MIFTVSVRSSLWIGEISIPRVNPIFDGSQLIPPVKDHGMCKLWEYKGSGRSENFQECLQASNDS